MNNHTKHKIPKVGCLYKFNTRDDWELVVKVLRVGKFPSGLPKMHVRVVKSNVPTWEIGTEYGKFSDRKENGWGFTSNDWKFIGSGVSKYEI